MIIASPRPLFYPLFRKVNKNIENKRVHSDQLNFNELHRAFGEIRFQGNILYIGSVDTQFEGHNIEQMLNFITLQILDQKNHV